MRAYYLRPGSEPSVLDLVDDLKLFSVLVGDDIRQLSVNWNPADGGLVLLIDAISHLMQAPLNFAVSLAPFGGPNIIQVLGPALLMGYDAQAGFENVSDDDIALFRACMKRPLQ